MKGILDSLLDVNRIESGSLVPSTSDFQLNDVFDSVADDFRDLAKERGWFDPQSPFIVIGTCSR
jgi:signal transduction histidine kinase